MLIRVNVGRLAARFRLTFEPRELVARIQSVLRRGRPTSRGTWFAKGLEIDFEGREVKLAGKGVELTSAEFEILAIFVKNPGQVLSRDELMERTRGIDWDAFMENAAEEIPEPKGWKGLGVDGKPKTATKKKK